MKTKIKTIVSVGLSILSLAANAASVELLPQSAQVGGSFDIDLFLDATDTAGGHPGQYSGRVVIEYDPSQVSFVGFSFEAPASELYALEQIDYGSYETVSIGFQNALDSEVIGSYTFDALAGPDAVIGFGIYDYDIDFGTFANESPSNQSFVPDFVGAEVTVVPLPAAFWLLGSALAGMAWTGRRERDNVIYE